MEMCNVPHTLDSAIFQGQVNNENLKMDFLQLYSCFQWGWHCPRPKLAAAEAVVALAPTETKTHVSSSPMRVVGTKDCYYLGTPQPSHPLNLDLHPFSYTQIFWAWAQIFGGKVVGCKSTFTRIVVADAHIFQGWEGGVHSQISGNSMLGYRVVGISPNTEQPVF